MSDTNNPDTSTVIDSIDEVQLTVLRTLFGMIRSFVEHLPFLFGGKLVLLLTWALASAISKFSQKLLSHWDKTVWHYSIWPIRSSVR